MELAGGGSAINGDTPPSLKKITKSKGRRNVNICLIDRHTNEWMHVIIYLGLTNYFMVLSNQFFFSCFVTVTIKEVSYSLASGNIPVFPVDESSK